MATRATSRSERGRKVRGAATTHRRGMNGSTGARGATGAAWAAQQR